MLRVLLALGGFIVSITPRKILHIFANILGYVTFLFAYERRHIALSNLHHAFPDKDDKWRSHIALTSFKRIVELGLLSAAGSFFSKKRIKSDFKLSKNFKKTIESIQNAQNGAVIILPHTSMMESTTFLPFLLEDPTLKICVIYRPFGVQSLEKWILKTRQRFGLTMLSRSKGFLKAKQTLQDKGIVSLLFDQHAGESGARVEFMGRNCSTTELPAALAEHYHTPVYMVYPKRLSFMSAEIQIEKIASGKSVQQTTFNINQALADRLLKNEKECEDWLWMHNRWKINFETNQLFSIHSDKKNWFLESQEQNKYFLQNQQRIIVRMPNWLGDVVMAIPILRAIKNCRPDVELSVLCQKNFEELLLSTSIADKIYTLPEKNWKYFFEIKKLKKHFFDIHVLLTNSLRSDIEALAIGAQTRIGIERANKRFFLTNTFKLSKTFDEQSIHQTHLWEKMLKHFGLKGHLDLSPIKIQSEQESNDYTIGIIAGSENSSEKQWPTSSWKILIELLIGHYKNCKVKLYGSKFNIKMIEKICVGYSKTNVINMAGKTSLLEFVQNLNNDKFILAIDTGGLHLANMIGKQTIALFGPTNSLRTGPIFSSPKIIVRPPGCPAKGGCSIEDIDVIEFFDKIKETMD